MVGCIGEPCVFCGVDPIFRHDKVKGKRVWISNIAYPNPETHIDESIIVESDGYPPPERLTYKGINFVLDTASLDGVCVYTGPV